MPPATLDEVRLLDAIEEDRRVVAGGIRRRLGPVAIVAGPDDAAASGQQLDDDGGQQGPRESPNAHRATLARPIHEPPAESARCAAAARESAGRDAVVSVTRRGSGRPIPAADGAQIAPAGGGLMNRSGW